LSELIKLYPHDKHMLSFAGNFIRGVDDGQALQYFTRATTIDPTFAAPYNQIGYIHIRNGDYVKAEQALKQYVTARSDRPNPYDSTQKLLGGDEKMRQGYKERLEIREVLGSRLGREIVLEPRQ
jgi:Tfp pilus assembly protein PilF